MKLSEQYSEIKAELELFDQRLIERLSEAEEPVKTATTALIQAGGKRSRPLLCMIASNFGDGEALQLVDVCIALELVHMSSLIHDDIIDQAPVRRGDRTIHHKYTNQVATYIGDYLVAEALEIMSEIADQKAHQLFSSTLKYLALGELAQYKNRYQMNPSLTAYFRKNRNKTARLIALSCQLGAITTNAISSIQKQLYLFGYYLGMSYQIIDDILDFTSTADDLGKASGQDLRSGYLTLPTLLAIQDKQIFHELELIFNRHQLIKEFDFDPIVADIKNTDAIQRSYQYSQWYLNQAIKQIKRLPDKKEKDLLYQLVGYLSKRTH
ncbi:polyprenyl synthetase family protein [Amphibacillus indicireducens]|uniref:Heptaprenyl diphosphate synthase component II n=1 Tax=Amphibacillus indicireducens TaxID=1076330 RepID=A0ABP7VQL0_9BACI